MSGLKLFTDPISQPCRAVMILLDINKIQFETVLIQILKGEHKTNQELKAVNPNCLIPALLDGTFSLYESGAILRYICNTRPVADNWYPKDPKIRAKVDQYLDWHHSAIRISTVWFLAQYVSKKPPSDPEIVKVKEKLVASLTILDSHTLKENKFIAGENISIADLQLLCELSEFWIVNKNIYAGFQRIEEWVKNCVELLNPHFDHNNAAIMQLKESGALGSDPDPLK
ncbi:Glutathione S-transferase theta-2B-like [Oopsacas minuta]|uniref:Glutathione S-transferase theta-2B-like n=1 Tax=Oopsacas minuta TaxID=111878 RepID=A0AAV7JV60_9METZ|nr:Glutathione S-transferase theta-2B-like [Oopsacas minuta]